MGSRPTAPLLFLLWFLLNAIVIVLRWSLVLWLCESDEPSRVIGTGFGQVRIDTKNHSRNHY